MSAPVPESPFPSLYFDAAREKLDRSGPAGAALGTELTRLWDEPPDVERLWPQIAGNRAYWPCLRSGSVPLAGIAQFALAALLTQNGLDARAMELLRFAQAYLPPELQQPARTLFGICDALTRQMRSQIERGMTAYDEGDFATAIAVYDEVIAHWPNAASAWFEKALAVEALEGPRNEGARALLQAVLLRDPFFARAYGIRSEVDRSVLATHVEPFLTSGDLEQRTLLARFATGAMRLGEHWSAAHARVYLGFVGLDPAPQPLLQLSLVELDVLDAAAKAPERGEPPPASDARTVVRGLVEEARERFAEGHLPAAAEVAARAVELREAGGDPRDIAHALSIRAGLPMTLGRAAEAAVLYEEALDIWEGLPDAEIVDRVLAHNNLASALLDQGQLLKARRVLSEAEKLWGSMEPGNAWVKVPVLLSRAKIETALGSATKASLLVARADELAREHLATLGALTPVRIEQVRANIALAREANGEAAVALRTALDEQRRIVGADHPENCFLENSLALALTHLGEHAEARELLAASLAKRQALFGPDSPEVAAVLHNQGRLAEGEDPALAARLFERALAIRRVKLPATDPDRVDTLRGLGTVRAHLGDLDGATDLLSEAAHGHFALVGGGAGATEAERQSISSVRRDTLGLLVTISLEDPSRWSTAFEALLNTRALSTGLSARRRAFVGRRRPLDEVIARYAAVAVRGPRQRDIDTYLADLSWAEERVDAESVQEDATSAAQPLPFVTTAEVAACLDPTTALVDLGVFTRARLPADTPQEMLGAGGRAYAATVVTATGIEAMVDLGPTTVIDRLVDDFREEIGLYVSLPAVPAIQAVSAQLLDDIARRLYDATLGRFESLLSRFERLVLSLDGAAALIPYACLVAPDGRHAVERWVITYLSSVLDLFDRLEPRGDGTVAILADPDFGQSGAGGQPDPPTGGRAPFSEALRTPWTPLAGTREELQHILRVAGEEQVRAYPGRRASKSNLMEVGSPEVLHLATHGFYVDDSRVAVEELDGQHVEEIHARPLLRCGIVLAGVNERRDLWDVASDDGVLTGLELCTLDLSRTSLVVLNACATAEGSAVAGDAVHGLRRACHLAGAHAVVSCLWSVSDTDSAMVMADFYDGLVHGLPPDRALQQAAVSALRRAGAGGSEPPHPYHWAAWVMSGSVASTSMPLSRLAAAAASSVEIAVGRPTPFSVVDGLARTIYATAGERDGVEVFGRGQRVAVTLRNRSATPVQLVKLAVRLVTRERAPGPELHYGMLVAGLPATRRPAPSRDGRVRWVDSDQPGARKVAIDAGGLVLRDRCDVVLDVEATAPGLWEYVIEATIRNGEAETVTVSSATRLAVLLGTT